MFKNYLTIALRNLVKNKLYSAINIFGLAVGIASCILIVMFVRDELSYDRSFPNADRVYQLHTRFDVPGRSPMIGSNAPGIAAPALAKDFPQIETTLRLARWRYVLKRDADAISESVILADPTFFDVLDLPLISGDRKTALKDVSSMLISESMALKYFGTAAAVGRTLPVDIAMVGKRDYKVVGVFKDLPLNTHLEINFLAPLNESDFDKMPWMLRSWLSTSGWTYIKLRPGADIETIRRALPEFERRSIPNVSFGGQNINVSNLMTLSFMKLTDIHLHAPASGSLKPVGDIKTITTFSAVAVMILLIACINFTNLATARSSQRAREVALRKVLGAKRPQLVFQFLTESVLLAMVAFVVSLAMVEATLPLYNMLLQRQLMLDFLGRDGLLPAMLGIIVLVGLAAGAYPALLLSGFLPARILKANKSAAAEGSGRLRTALVVAQFAISIGLMICTAVVYGQTIYAKTMDLGYDRNGLMVIRGPSGEAYKSLRETVKTEAARLPGVKAVTLSDDVPTDRNDSNNVVEIPGQPPSPEPIVIGQKAVDYDFFSTYQVPLLAGRYLDQSHGGDDYSGTDEEKVRRGGNIVINEKAVARLGFGTPQNAVGKQLRIGVGSDGAEHSLQATVTIVGVVGNIFYRSVRDDLPPTYFAREAENLRNITIRYDGVSGAGVRDGVADLWRKLTTDVPYKAEFFDTLIADQYQQEAAEAKLFAAFSLLAVVIGCLGLYGLASFTAERRTKEIGIRKVLGAKVRDVIRLLVWDFSKPVLVANLIAWPLAFLLMRDWLNGFQYRIGLGLGPFLLAGLGALLVAWGTVGSHAARAARSNPIFALRYE